MGNAQPLPPAATPHPAPRPALHRVGRGGIPVVTVDHIWPDPAGVIAMAAAMAPFPPAGHHYPGVRRVIAAQDPAFAYVEALLERAAPYLAGAYDIAAFDLIEASFSAVTTAPGALDAVQRAPHFDATDPAHFAVMHYLRETAGTAFYRHRASGIEQVTEANLPAYLAHARREAAPAGYITGSNPHYEAIGAVEGIANRLVIYPGSLLHSGIITPETVLSADPALGRLTTNMFVRAVRV